MSFFEGNVYEIQIRIYEDALIVKYEKNNRLYTLYLHPHCKPTLVRRVYHD